MNLESSSNINNKENHLILEQSTLKSPIENLRKLFKVTSKTFDYNLGNNSNFKKDLNTLLLLSSETSESSSNNELESEEYLILIESLLSKLRGLKNKLLDLNHQSNNYLNITKIRLNYLNSTSSSSSNTTSTDSIDTNSRKRLSNHLIDYFLRSNPILKQSALILAKSEGIEELIDIELWNELEKVEQGLNEGKLTQVLAWAGENRTALKKLKSPLEFTVHLQAYIELCRSKSLVEAITYVKKFLSPMATTLGGNHLDELNQAMALLAFSPDTVCSPYRELYSQERWTSLTTLFRSTFLTLHSLSSLPLLHISLQAGLASLKTPTCCPRTISQSFPLQPLIDKNQSTTTTCPVCTSPLKELAKEVPYSHHLNSTIVCSLSGKVVEGGGGEGGELIALVSKSSGEGRVYSREALEMRVTKDPLNRLSDPRTGEIFSWQEVQKVFIS